MKEQVSSDRIFEAASKFAKPDSFSVQQSEVNRGGRRLQGDFAKVMQAQIEKMWAAKLGLSHFDSDLFNELETLMQQTPVDYTMFFRELSMVPDDIASLQKSFYKDSQYAMASMSSVEAPVGMKL